MRSKILFLCLVSLFLISFTSTGFAKKNNDVLKEKFEQTVSSKGLSAISITNPKGDVEISGKKTSEIEIFAVKKVFHRNKELAEEFMNEISISVEKRSGILIIKTTIPKYRDRNLFGWKKIKGYEIEYKIVVPEDFHAEIQNKYGDVSVVNVGILISENHNGDTFVDTVDGNTEINNSYGHVQAFIINGDLFSKNKNGNTRAKDIAGICDVDNSYGNVTISKVKRQTLVKNKNGKVDVSNAESSVNVTNSYGGVLIEEASDNITIFNKNGSVETTNIQGNADLTTSYDGIYCVNISGELKVANNNGYVNVSNIGGKAVIETSYNQVKGIDIKGPVSVISKNGSVYLKKIDGNIDVDTSYDTVEIISVNGSVEILNKNGKIIGDSITGNLFVSTSYSPVYLDKIAGTIKVKNKSGKVTVSGNPKSIDVSTSYNHVILKSVLCKNITAITSSGDVDADIIQFPAGAICYFETSYGDISLNLPKNVSTKISANVAKGNQIRLGKGLTITTNQLNKEKIEGKIGSGDGNIELRVERSGSIYINSN